MIFAVPACAYIGGLAMDASVDLFDGSYFDSLGGVWMIGASIFMLLIGGVLAIVAPLVTS